MDQNTCRSGPSCFGALGARELGSACLISEYLRTRALGSLLRSSSLEKNMEVEFRQLLKDMEFQRPEPAWSGGRGEYDQPRKILPPFGVSPKPDKIPNGTMEPQ